MTIWKLMCELDHIRDIVGDNTDVTVRLEDRTSLWLINGMEFSTTYDTLQESEVTLILKKEEVLP
ncbi:MAG: hypothetical protein IJ719_08265 [Clostridia bacterium]|nr:hypothetical protein [Clostridia bacterium]